MRIAAVTSGVSRAGWTTLLQYPPTMDQSDPAAAPAASGREHLLRMDLPLWSGSHSTAYHRTSGTVPPYTARDPADKSVSCACPRPTHKTQRPE